MKQLFNTKRKCRLTQHLNSHLQDRQFNKIYSSVSFQGICSPMYHMRYAFNHLFSIISCYYNPPMMIHKQWASIKYRVLFKSNKHKEFPVLWNLTKQTCFCYKKEVGGKMNKSRNATEHRTSLTSFLKIVSASPTYGTDSSGINSFTWSTWADVWIGSNITGPLPFTISKGIFIPESGVRMSENKITCHRISIKQIINGNKIRTITQKVWWKSINKLMSARELSYSIRLENMPRLQRNFHHEINIFRSFTEWRIFLTDGLVTLVNKAWQIRSIFNQHT